MTTINSASRVFDPQRFQFAPLPARRSNTSIKYAPSRRSCKLRLSRAVPVSAALPGLQQLQDGVSSLRDATSDSAVALQDSMAAVAATPEVTEAAAAVASDPSIPERKVDWIARVADPLEDLLRFFQDRLHDVGVEQAAGWSIIAVILVIKLVTYPTTKTTVESSLAQQNLKPILDAIKRRYPNNKEKQQAETSKLYRETGVNPLAGCLPSLIQLPIFWGLYRALQNASEDNLFSEPFLWIPDLAGPTTAAARQAGTGMAWLLPLDDNNVPPIGDWDTAARYLVLPVLIVVVQLISQEVLKQPDDPNEDPEEKQKRETTQQVLKFLPFMLGYFALNVPSGLGLYWFSNSVSTTLIQAYLRYGGGANPLVADVMKPPTVSYGCAIRTTTPVPRGAASPEQVAAPAVAADGAAAAEGGGASDAEGSDAESATEEAPAAPAAPTPPPGSNGRQGVLFDYPFEDFETGVVAAAAMARADRLMVSKRCKRNKDVNRRIVVGEDGQIIQPVEEEEEIISVDLPSSTFAAPGLEF